MKQPLSIAVSLLAAALCATALRAQPTGQWDFENGDLTATLGSPMTYLGGAAAGTSFGTTTSFGIPDIDGQPARVMMFPALQDPAGYGMPTPPSVNGGGSLVNDYTILLDVLYPAGSDGLIRPILQTDDKIISAAADLIVDSSNGIGPAGGPFFGSISPNTWYRIGFAVNGSGGSVAYFINGTQVGSSAIVGGIDNVFALTPGGPVAVFNNTSTNAAPGYVNSLQIRDEVLTADQMAALGGPSREGVPQVIPTIPSFLVTWMPAGAVADRSTSLGAIINSGEAVIADASITLSLNGTILSRNISRSGRLISVKNTGTPLTAGSKYTLALAYTDDQAGEKTFSTEFKAALLFEDFEGLSMGTSLEEEAGMTNVWTTNAPIGWVVDRSRMPGITNDAANNGMIEWAGWNFARKDWWVDRAGNQERVTFVHGQGNVAIADPDEWDDAAHPQFDEFGNALYFTSFLTTKSIDLTGVSASSVFVKFDSSWRPEGFDDWGGTNNQTGTISVSYDGGAPVEILHWDSQTDGPFFHPDATDEPVVLALNNPAGAGGLTLTFGLTRGGNDWWWAFDNLEINTGPIAPAILTHPQSQTIDVGSTVSFSVAASGDQPLSYQWKKDGNAIPGATASTYSINLVAVGDAGAYTVVVSNDAGPITSDAATLIVISTPLITQQPLSQFVSPGAAVAFTAVARGGQPLAYQWKKDGNEIPGATAPTYSIASAEAVDEGTYTVEVSNTFGSTTSDNAPLTIFAGAITSDLVAHLKFDNDLADSSGRGNNGTAMGAPGFTTGQIGSGALTFTSDGASINYVTLGAVSDLDFGSSTDFSVAIWAQLPPGSWSGDPSFIANKDWGSGSNNGWVLATDNDGRLQWNYREAAPNTRKDFDSPGGFFNDGRWHHVATVFQRGQTAKTYLDGVLIDIRPIKTGTEAPTSIATGLPTNIGQDGTGAYGEKFVDARADDVGIWRRALTPQEVTAVYNAGVISNDLSTADINAPAPPLTILEQPQSVVASTGGTASFSVKAYGGVPISYQWRLGSTDLPGATRSSYAIASVQTSDAGNYTVVITNPSGSITSAPVTLSIVSTPIVSVQPLSQVINENLDATLSVTASGGTLTYQWQYNGADIVNATNATLSLPSIQPDQSGAYAVVVGNSAGSTTSDTATVTVISVGSIAVTGQWDFNSGNLDATVGLPLEYFDATVQADTAFGTTTSFGIPDIGGEPASVMKLTPSGGAWGGYKMFHGAAPNGGSFVNRYTLIYDVYYPPESASAWRALLQTDNSNGNDGEFFVNTASGVGISGNYQGIVTGATWHRIVLSVDLSGPAVAKYIDGIKVGYQILGAGTDGRWSLDSSALLFADEDGETSTAFVSSIQFRNGKLPDAAIAALGAPTACKIPGGISIVRQGNDVVVHATGCLGIEGAPAVDGPWTAITGATDPYVTPATGSMKFFKPTHGVGPQ